MEPSLCLLSDKCRKFLTSGPQYTCSGCRGTKAHTLSQALLFLPQAHPRTHASLPHQSIFQVLPHHFLYRIAHTAFPLTALYGHRTACTRSFISFICRELYVLHTNTPPGFSTLRISLHTASRLSQ